MESNLFLRKKNRLGTLKGSFGYFLCRHDSDASRAAGAITRLLFSPRAQNSLPNATLDSLQNRRFGLFKEHVTEFLCKPFDVEIASWNSLSKNVLPFLRNGWKCRNNCEFFVKGTYRFPDLITNLPSKTVLLQNDFDSCIVVNRAVGLCLLLAGSLKANPASAFGADLCQCGCLWRKRTRVATNSSPARQLCASSVRPPSQLVFNAPSVLDCRCRAPLRLFSGVLASAFVSMPQFLR